MAKAETKCLVCGASLGEKWPSQIKKYKHGPRCVACSAAASGTARATGRIAVCVDCGATVGRRCPCEIKRYENGTRCADCYALARTTGPPCAFCGLATDLYNNKSGVCSRPLCKAKDTMLRHRVNARRRGVKPHKQSSLSHPGRDGELCTCVVCGVPCGWRSRGQLSRYKFGPRCPEHHHHRIPTNNRFLHKECA